MDSKSGQSLENDNREKLFSACYRGDVDLIEQLLSLGLDIDIRDSHGRTPLMVAASAGQPYLFNFLIARGSDHTLEINFDWSLLHFAAAGGSNVIIEKLLSLGLDIDIPNIFGITPLMVAAFVGQSYLFNFLIARGSDYTLKDNCIGWSLLHCAARGGSDDIIEKLLFLGLDIDSRDNDGRTPLMTAACSKKLESFLLLIEQGSDPLLKDNNGTGALFWAVQSFGKDSIAKLLSPSLTPFEQVQTAIILAISKYDESSSMIFARDVDRRDGTGYGQVFQLKNENGFIWENGRIRAEKLQFGSLVIYLDYGDFNSCKCTYWLKRATKPQHVTKIQEDLYSSECIYPGISDAFPEARIHPTGLAVNVMPDSSIAVIGMKEACIEDERLYLTTYRDEKCSVKLLSREHLQLSTTSTKLSLRHPSDHLRDCAVLQIIETQRWPTLHTNSTYSAVCVGLLLERRPTVISIKNELVDIKNADGEWMKVVGKVLVDTGNEAPTGISRKLVQELGLKPDTSKEVNVTGAGGTKVQCSGTVQTEVKVRDRVFSIEALVDLPTSNVDLLIGKDIIRALFHLNFTFGE